MSEAWSEQAPWEENAHALTQLPSGGDENEATKGSACLATIRRSVLECREALGPSIKSHEAQDFVGRPRGESRGVSRERTKYGCTYHRSGGRSWSDASRALSTSVLARGRGGKNRALAGRKLEALLTRGTSREKANRCATKRFH